MHPTPDPTFNIKTSSTYDLLGEAKAFIIILCGLDVTNAVLNELQTLVDGDFIDYLGQGRYKFWPLVVKGWRQNHSLRHFYRLQDSCRSRKCKLCCCNSFLRSLWPTYLPPNWSHNPLILGISLNLQRGALGLFFKTFCNQSTQLMIERRISRPWVRAITIEMSHVFSESSVDTVSSEDSVSRTTRGSNTHLELAASECFKQTMGIPSSLS